MSTLASTRTGAPTRVTALVSSLGVLGLLISLVLVLRVGVL
jgi:hypothetical protein